MGSIRLMVIPIFLIFLLIWLIGLYFLKFFIECRGTRVISSRMSHWESARRGLLVLFILFKLWCFLASLSILLTRDGKWPGESYAQGGGRNQEEFAKVWIFKAFFSAQQLRRALSAGMSSKSTRASLRCSVNRVITLFYF